MTTFTFFSDSGHAWLRVRPQDCRNVGLNIGSFSRYSYYDATYLYLEEDCDAAKFVNAYRERFHCSPIIHDEYIPGRLPIRNKARLP